jgi:hypothetical protein
MVKNNNHKRIALKNKPVNSQKRNIGTAAAPTHAEPPLLVDNKTTRIRWIRHGVNERVAIFFLI